MEAMALIEIDGLPMNSMGGLFHGYDIFLWDNPPSRPVDFADLHYHWEIQWEYHGFVPGLCARYIMIYGGSYVHWVYNMGGTLFHSYLSEFMVDIWN